MEQAINLDREDGYDYINPFGDRRGNMFNSVWTFDLNEDAILLAKYDEIYSAPLGPGRERLLTLDDFHPLCSPRQVFPGSSFSQDPIGSQEWNLSHGQNHSLAKSFTTLPTFGVIYVEGQRTGSHL